MLDAAVGVFSQRGFHLASMDEIAEAAGVSKPMIYAYLGSKDDLFAACIRREARRLVKLITSAAPPELAIQQRLHHGLLAFFTFVTEHRDGWIVLYRQARARQPSAGEIATAREQIIARVADLLMPGNDEITALPIAYALIGAVEALSDWALDHPEETSHDLTTRLIGMLRLPS